MTHIDTVLAADPATDSPVVAAIRRKVMEGRATVDDFAKGIGRTPSMVNQYIAAGLPVVHIGRSVFVEIDAALGWLQNRHKRRQEPPRGRGRPTKTA
jgi:hypothetical protein